MNLFLMVPQTPVEELLDDTTVEQMMSPQKVSKHGDSGDVSLLSSIRNIEHLDIEPDVPLESDDVEC